MSGKLRVLNAYAGIGGNRHLWPDDWQITAIELDPRVAAEYLRELGKAYVVENVHVYYTPPIPPDLVTDRHYYWTSNPPAMLSPLHGIKGILNAGTPARVYANAYGLPQLPPGAVGDARKAMRNAVVPLEGLEVAVAAFAPVEVLA